MRKLWWQTRVWFVCINNTEPRTLEGLSFWHNTAMMLIQEAEDVDYDEDPVPWVEEMLRDY